MRLFRKSRAVVRPPIARPPVEVPPPQIRPFHPSAGTEGQSAARIAQFTPAEREVWDWGQVTPTTPPSCIRGSVATEVDFYLLMYQLNRAMTNLEHDETP